MLFLSTPSEGFTRLRVPLVALGGREGRGQPASGGHCERRWGCCWAERSSLPVNRPAPEPPSQFPI